MFAKLKIALFVAGGIIVGLFLMFFKGRASGIAKVEEEVRQKEVADVKAVAEKRVENSKVVKDVQQTVIHADDKSVDDELLSDWTRPDSRK